MEKDNPVKSKSFVFAIRIVKLNKFLTDNQEYVISKQLLRCGTSVGANVREAINAESKLDFIHKLSIAQKECDETMYWLELLKETNYLNEVEFLSIYFDAEELIKLIKRVIISTKSNLNKN